MRLTILRDKLAGGINMDSAHGCNNSRAVDMALAERVREAIDVTAIKQSAIAETLGLDLHEWSLMACGEQRIGAERLFQIAELTGRSISWFFAALTPTLH
jgi:hypothetical protein